MTIETAQHIQTLSSDNGPHTDLDTAKRIQVIIGLAHLNISFKVHNSPFKVRGHLVDGVTYSYDNDVYMVEFVGDCDAVHTILHELAHVDGNVRGEGRSCQDCDQFADDVVWYVKQKLGVLV